MCELFAMSSRTPTTVAYSLHEFSRNGSSLRHNRDGWGIAFARDRDAVLVKEAHPAIDSAWVKFVAEQPIKTTAAIAHVRYATRGEHTMENTHPFRRNLGHRAHLFAHNGTLAGIEKAASAEASVHMPIGETDSELAFCTLLSRLQKHYDKNEAPSLQTRFDVFSGFCHDMKQLGPSNFLYHDGEVLFAHAHQRIFEEAGQLVGPKAPAMHIKRCWTSSAPADTLDCQGLTVEVPDQQTVLLASIPLDDDGWEALPQGSVLAIKNGTVVMQA